jgi:hypothetical protein
MPFSGYNRSKRAGSLAYSVAAAVSVRAGRLTGAEDLRSHYYEYSPELFGREPRFSPHGSKLAHP